MENKTENFSEQEVQNIIILMDRGAKAIAATASLSEGAVALSTADAMCKKIVALIKKESDVEGGLSGK